MHIHELIFQQKNVLVHKSKITGNFFLIIYCGYESNLSSRETLKQPLQKQTVFWENFERKAKKFGKNFGQMLFETYLKTI